MFENFFGNTFSMGALVNFNMNVWRGEKRLITGLLCNAHRCTDAIAAKNSPHPASCSPMKRWRSRRREHATERVRAEESFPPRTKTSDHERERERVGACVWWCACWSAHVCVLKAARTYRSRGPSPPKPKRNPKMEHRWLADEWFLEEPPKVEVCEKTRLKKSGQRQAIGIIKRKINKRAKAKEK